MTPNIPETTKPRVVIIGMGFGGLALARKLADCEDLQVVLIDKNNYHQFQPLFYQVATAGLEPSSIAFPLRKAFQSEDNVHIRITEVTRVDPVQQCITTGLGDIRYQYLVLAMGADTNFFGMPNIINRALPMKSVGEALAMRNRLLENFEKALVSTDPDERQGLMSVVVVGGGPTGVELSGTLSEMKTHILPKDYPDLDFQGMQITLVESGGELLGPMSKNAQEKSKEYLERLGVKIMLNSRVVDFDGHYVYLKDGSKLRTNNLVWAAGVKASLIEGIGPELLGRGGRIKVNRFNQVEGYPNLFAIGDVALMSEPDFPDGHPQLAQPAMQQGKLLAENLNRLINRQPLEEFHYRDLGSMATVGRNLAVVDLPFWKFGGFFAWLVWMVVHLFSIVGVKNRLLIFINWFWNYLTYDQSLRLIIRAKPPREEIKAEVQKAQQGQGSEVQANPLEAAPPASVAAG
jgi:NADH dehydrogenase